MKIITNSEAIQETLTFIALTPVSEDEVADRQRAREDGTLKTDRHGKPTYSVAVKVLEDGQEARDTYINVRTPAAIPALTPLKPVGEVEVNVFSTRSGAITVITVDRFEVATAPARQASPQQGQPVRKPAN